MMVVLRRLCLSVVRTVDGWLWRRCRGALVPAAGGSHTQRDEKLLCSLLYSRRRTSAEQH